MNKPNKPAAARRGRDPKKESLWRERLFHQTRSGLTVRAFCQRETLQETAFYFWRREIRCRDRQVIGKRTAPLAFVEVRAAPMPATVAAAGPDFGELSRVELVCPEPVDGVEGVGRACREPVERESPLELVFPDDRRLLIRAGCDAALLARVVAVLAVAGLPKGEAKPC